VTLGPVNDESTPGTPRMVSSMAPRFWKARQFSRFRADMKVQIYLPGEERARRGHTSDVSEGGLGGIMVADIRLGETVTLEFSGPPLLRPVRVEAVVRNRVGYRYGFEFLSLSREQRALIHAASLFLPAAA
jgi:hypothetical protein